MENEKELEIGIDFTQDVKLNRFKLDEESQKNPSLVHYYGELLATAKAERDKAYNKVKFMMAQTEMDYRMNPPRDIKITEATITALIETDNKVLIVKEELVKAQEKVYHLEAAVTALDDRRSELKNLTQLWIAGYYSVPGIRQNDIAQDMRNKLNKE